MLGKAKFNVTINMVNYKKGETYEIKNQVTIDGLNYFEIVGEKSTAPKPGKKETPVVGEKSTAPKPGKKETPVVVEKPIIKEVEETETVVEETETVVEETLKTEGENFNVLEK